MPVADRSRLSRCACLALSICALVLARGLEAQQYNLNGAPLFLGNAGTDQAAARAKVEARKSQREDWEVATLCGDYLRVGKKDPRWDDDVRDGLTSYGKYLSDAPQLDRLSDRPPLRETARATLERALAAGCPDPLVRYCALAIGLPSGNKPTADAEAREAAAAEQAVESSQYAAIWKFRASLRAAKLAGRAVAQAAADTGRPAGSPPGTDYQGSLDRARLHLMEVVRDTGTPRVALEQAVADFVRTLRVVPGAAAERAYTELGKTLLTQEWIETARDSAAFSIAAGMCWVGDAWNGNEDLHAGMPADSRWKTFQERLARAQKSLENAWRLDPSDPRAAIAMMSVERGQHEGRERLERWFRHAMDADPDCFVACLEKLTYLEPRWYGDAAQMVEFGHLCQATRDWPARLPFILVEAHRRVAASTPHPADYWRRPDVWNDVQTVYRDCLAVARPDAVYERSSFALYACTAGQWKVATGLFKELGDHPNLRALGGMSPAQYKELVARAASLAAMKPEQADALTAQDEPMVGGRGASVDAD